MTPQPVNGVRFDDFLLGTNGFVSTIPIPPSSFIEPLRVIQVVYDGAFGFTLIWNAIPGQTYTVQRRNALDSGSWETIATDYPPGGATEAVVSLIDDFDVTLSSTASPRLEFRSRARRASEDQRRRGCRALEDSDRSFVET